ncbi:MAG TPA: M13 family metallopeptidase N-terminal domain-containing protein, partial [Polyangium sp.]|nr:M13 family metallopeptidase N-terminal domain-containing protein [Polyangium sp.]
MSLRPSLRSSLIFVVACAAAACQPGAAGTPKNPDAAGGKLVDESQLPKLPRFDATEFDTTKSICQDLDAHVNSKWISQNPIPADKTTWGTFEMLDERSAAVQKQIVEAAAKKQAAPGTVQQQIGDLFAAGMDEAKLEAEGITAVKPLVDEVNGLKDAASIAEYLRRQFALGRQFVFSFSPGEDFKDAKSVIGYAQQDGLSLPEKAYYTEAKYQDKRDAFVAHVERLLVLGGVDANTAKTRAKAVLAFETRLAGASLSPIELRDPANTYNFVSLDEADKASPNFSWSKFMAAEKLSGVKGFSLSQPKFFAEFDKMLTEVPAADWQAYLQYHIIEEAAPYVNDALSKERFAFYGKVMRGQQEQKPRWKRVLDTINDTL